MSKIAKQKANQWILKHKDGDVLYVQDAYIAAYDQAFQDFLEKAEEFFKNELYVSISDKICSHNNFTSVSNFIEQFKNYMR